MILPKLLYIQALNELCALPIESVWTVWGSSNYTNCSFDKSAKALKKSN